MSTYTYTSSYPTNYYDSHSQLVNDVLAQAGPAHLYRRSGYDDKIVSNVTKVTTEITHEPSQTTSVQYRINEDSDPVRIVRPITPVTHRQNIRVRYLEPPNPPTPAPIIIQERQLTPAPPAPPIVVR